MQDDDMETKEDNLKELLRNLARRRRQLGMSYRALAERSGVSEPTAKRVLSPTCDNAEMSTVSALARAMGVRIGWKLEGETPQQFKEREAERVAVRVVNAVQGSSALEAEAVGEQDMKNMVRQTVHELMASSPSRIWSAR